MAIVVVLLIVGLIFLANVVRQQEAETFHKLFDLLLIGLNAPLFFVGVLLVFQNNELRDIVDFRVDSPTAVGIFLQATAVWGVIVCFRSSRHSLERFLPIDPHSPVHTLALVLSGYFAGFAILEVSGGLENLAETLTELSVGAFFIQNIGFVALAFLGVGFRVRRSWAGALRRLGLEKLNGRQIVESIGWIVLLVLLQTLGGVTWEAINPEDVELVENISQTLYQDFGFWHWLALAVGAGVGEEILFRGALQPVFGIWFTSLLFAVVHVQYGLLTPATLVLFLLAVILGFIRRRHNTGMAILVHFGYDFVLGMITLLTAAA
ncbi:CPBP family intramembrane glutamic endopeptidase [Candidatus Leptofilum sp.]|uniref:CPBP family intramembrane glutamic endopeptidase n=1 Tax=Candidatus Leptofilum sp. TaxID=3241576 RepID=UPI003B5CE362